MRTHFAAVSHLPIYRHSGKMSAHACTSRCCSLLVTECQCNSQTRFPHPTSATLAIPALRTISFPLQTNPFPNSAPQTTNFLPGNQSRHAHSFCCCVPFGLQVNNTVCCIKATHTKLKNLRTEKRRNFDSVLPCVYVTSNSSIICLLQNVSFSQYTDSRFIIWLFNLLSNFFLFSAGCHIRVFRRSGKVP